VRGLAGQETSANGRTYYLTQALESAGQITVTPPAPSAGARGLLEAMPIANIMAFMPIALDPVRSRHVNARLGFRFTDTGEDFTLHIRRGVAELRTTLLPNTDAQLITTTTDWKALLVAERGAGAKLILSRRYQFKGKRLLFLKCLRLFQTA